MNPSLTNEITKAVLLTLAWLVCAVQGIIVPSGKIGPITPYRSTPRPTLAPGTPLRDPAPVVEYSADHPEPPPLDPSYVPTSYKTLSALSGNSIFYIPLKIKNVHEFQGNSFSYVSQPSAAPASTQQDAVAQTDQKFVTWKGTYNSPARSDQNVNVNIPVPIYEVDYAFPKKQRYRQTKPIVVAPLPSQTQAYYQQQYNNNNFGARTQQAQEQDKKKYYSNKPSASNNNGQYHYPKKYSTDGSTTKYYYYVKHD